VWIDKETPRFIKSVNKAWGVIQTSTITFLSDNTVTVDLHGLMPTIHGRWSSDGKKKTLKIRSQGIPLQSVAEGIDFFFNNATTTFEVIDSDIVCKCDIAPLFEQLLKKWEERYGSRVELTDLRTYQLDKLRNAQFVLTLHKR